MRWIRGRQQELHSTEKLNSLRENDKYYLDKARTWAQIIPLWTFIAFLGALSVGFVVIFGKYIWSLAFCETRDLHCETILGNILDFTMKIAFGWLVKSYFEKK